MDKQDYDKAIKECWNKFCESHPYLSKSLVAQKAFQIIFDHIHHNLTSDAEGEEMLTVSRKNVQRMYSYNEGELTKDPTNKGALLLKLRLDALFGSKCLPDEGTDCTPVEVGVAENATTSNVDSSHGNVESLEPKPSIPKFKHKLGDKVRIVNDWSYGYKHNGEVTEIVAIDESDPEVPYKVDIYDEEEGGGLWYQESDLEPYTEPKKKRHVSVKEACEILGVDESEATTLVKSKPIETCTDYCSSPDHFVVKDEMVDNIIKDGFKNHNRLNIAAMAMQGFLSNANRMKKYEYVATKPPCTELAVVVARNALRYADALIAEAEKGGVNA